MGSLWAKPPDQADLVISLDVGSFASGYAILYYSDYKNNRNTPNIYVNKVWGGNQKREDHKTETALLIMEEENPNKDLFGQKAIETNSEHDEHPEWRFYERFKMQLLQPQRSIDCETKLEDSKGRHLRAITVLSRLLKCLKNHALDRVQHTGLVEDRWVIKWIITVPAIWPDRAKGLMRLAALKADIPGANLVIALEPECAAIQVIRTLKAKAPDLKSPGSVFLVVDIGGGTVDVVLLEVIDEHHRMKQVQAPEGGPWGGNNVDEKFFNMLRHIIGEDVLSTFEAEHRLEFLDLQREFEYEKRTVCHNTDPEAKPFRFKIPSGLFALWTSKRGEDITEIVKNLTVNGKKLEWIASRLVFPPDVMWSIFKETTDKMTECIRRCIAKAQPRTISAILAVGGFSCSQYVIHALKKDLSDLRIPVIQPWDADFAVLKGAALYGYDENSIVSRTLPFTYGLSCIKTFELGRHSDQHMFENNDAILANAVFQKIVTRGQTVKSSDWIDANVYDPIDNDFPILTIYVHASLEENPIHITDKSCWYVGKVDVDYSKLFNDLQSKKIRVSMKFGGTEIEVKAEHIASGKCNVFKLLLP